jgi:hypothetical protein
MVAALCTVIHCKKKDITEEDLCVSASLFGSGKSRWRVKKELLGDSINYIREDYTQ